MIKSIHHICIETDCYTESISFYCSLLGFEIIEETENFHGREFNAWLKNGGIIIELQTARRESKSKLESANKKGIVHVCFIVDDLTDAVDYLKSKGFDSFRKKNNEIIYSVKGGDLAKITAPEGTVIELRSE